MAGQTMTRARKLLRQERGSVVIMVAAGMVVLLGMTALVVDVGWLFFHRHQLANAADAAALAGAASLADGEPAAVAEAEEYARENGTELAEVQISASAAEGQVQVQAQRTVPLFFARALGRAEGTVGAGATALVGSISATRGAVPLGVQWADFIFGETYTLKAGAQSGETGNYGALALGARGASTYEENLRYGYQEWLEVGEWVETEPGNMSGPTYDGINHRLGQCPHDEHDLESLPADCPCLIIVPIISELPAGRDDVEILGFALFLAEEVTGHGNKSYVTGKFIEKAYLDGRVDPGFPSPYGASGVRLVD